MLQPRITALWGCSLLKATPIPMRGSSLAIKRRQKPLIRQFTTGLALRKPVQTAPQPPDPPKDEEAFVPKPLGRPIGFSAPPQPGENSGFARPKKDYSGMTMKERNLAKRADLVEKWGTNYFRDFKNIRKYREGKTFVANPRIFKKDVAMYFPNLHGDTLEGAGKDTTDVLSGKISVVNLYSSAWGEAQVKTFTGNNENPELHEILKENEGITQQVDVNVEENTLKAWIVQMFAWRLRITRKKEEWGRYFVVRRGINQMIRESIGALNGRVGYVYLVDADCKIRWAGSANAEGTEKDDLVKGLRRCVEEIKNPKAAASRPKTLNSVSQTTAASA